LRAKILFLLDRYGLSNTPEFLAATGARGALESGVALFVDGAVGAGIGFRVLAGKRLPGAGDADIEFMAGVTPCLAGGLWLAPSSAYLGIGIGDFDTKGAETVATVAEGGRCDSTRLV